MPPTKKKSTPPSLSTSRIERWYGKIATAFALLSVVLLVLIGYFSFSNTTITITPAIVTQEVALETTLKDLNGVFLLADVEDTLVYDNIEGTEQVAKSTGTVTLYNKYSAPQPLVETTRLLSDTGVLFRTTETVTVPVGGEVEVGIIADEEGPQGKIGPAHFEVVALWDGLKDQIYGESTEATSSGTITVGVVDQTAIANARTELDQQLTEKGIQIIKEDFGTRKEGLPENALLLEVGAPAIISTAYGDPSAEIGTETDSFSITNQRTVAVPVINSATLEEMIQGQFGEEIADGFTASDTSLSFDDMSITVVSLSDDNSDAVLEVTVPMQSTITENHVILQPEALIHKTEPEIQSFLSQYPEISSVNVSFSPFWVKRTPDVAGSITIKLAQ